MIWYYLILFITSVLTAVFSWLPQITTLPQVLGIDIDTTLVTGVGMLKSFTVAFWMIGDVISGFLVLLGYYAIKVVLVVFLGARAPVGR